MGTKPLVICECTCGRKNRDLADLAVIREQFHRTPGGKASTYSLVVCMRNGCGGKYRSADIYVGKLDKIWWGDYIQNKIGEEPTDDYVY
jgi:hypothetical protein